MLLSFFLLALAIHNVWPKRMSLKAFAALYTLLLLAGIPVRFLACVPYGLFGILGVVCIFGLVTGRDTAPQNVCMGMIGFVLTAITEDFLAFFLNTLIPPALSDRQYVFFGVGLIRILLFYFITLLCGRLFKKLLLTGKGILRFQQTWYLIDAALLLLVTIYLFDDLIPGQDGSIGRMIYNNILHISGYLLVMLFVLLAMRRFYLEQMRTGAKQKALLDLQDYTHNLETDYRTDKSLQAERLWHLPDTISAESVKLLCLTAVPF